MELVWIAFGLFLVFEGLLPTLAPGVYRRMLETLSQLPQGALRLTGLIFIAIGTIIIFIAKN